MGSRMGKKLRLPMKCSQASIVAPPPGIRLNSLSEAGSFGLGGVEDGPRENHYQATAPATIAITKNWRRFIVKTRLLQA